MMIYTVCVLILCVVLLYNIACLRLRRYVIEEHIKAQELEIERLIRKHDDNYEFDPSLGITNQENVIKARYN